MKTKQKQMSVKPVIFVVLGVILVAYIIFAIRSYIFPYVPQFFPLNNPSGRYVITKGCPSGQGWKKDNTSVMSKDGYCIEYTGNGVLNLDQEQSNFYRITVGNSNQDLEQFLNKEVVISSGQFVNSDKQCVANHNCLSIGGSSTVLNIDSVKAK